MLLREVESAWAKRCGCRYGPGACAWSCAKLMACGRFGGAPKFGTLKLTAVLGPGRQTSLVVNLRPQIINGVGLVICEREGARFRMAEYQPPRGLAGCRNGKPRPAKGGEERRMDSRGEVRMTLDGARQGRRDELSRREAGAASVKCKR